MTASFPSSTPESTRREEVHRKPFSDASRNCTYSLPVTRHRIIQTDTKYFLPQNRSIKRHSRESDYVFLAENWWNSFYFTCRSNSALCKTKTREVAVTNIVIALTSLRPRPCRFREPKLAAYFSSGRCSKI